MDRVLQGTVPTHTEDPHESDGIEKRHLADSLSIVHVFDHIIALGGQAKGSVKRLDFFGHGWKEGPILVNTSERASYKARPDRDPRDKDGRAHKDFVGIHANFKKAFAADAQTKLWGCDYNPLWRRAIQKAAKMRDKNAEISNGMSANDVRDHFRDNIVPESYMAQLAKASGVTCWGVPLGLGTRFVKAGKGKRYQRITANVPREYRWWKKEMGKEPDYGGFLPYDP